MSNSKIDVPFYLRIMVSLSVVLLLIFVQGCTDSEQPATEPIETLPMNQVSLDNLDAFQSTDENWQVAGGVESNRREKHDLLGLEGTGTLVNIPTDEAQGHLLTEWTHGDLELELDFLMPKGSNSGIYLMGRYEVQLLDSWGVEDPEFSDVGGIYQRWDEHKPEGEQGFEGSAPRMNVARAPGLWQHVRILFSAPEFNEQGEKISNAEFEEVWINGVLVQEEVKVSGPTRAALFDDEQAEGPLMIQGDHGPVAVQNISYKKYDKNSISLNNLQYKYYAGTFDQMPDFNTLEATESGATDSLSGSVVDKDERYALRYTGTIETPNGGTYLFKLQNAGKVRMLIDDNLIFEQDRFYRMHETVSETVELESGHHDFTLEYVDHHNDWYWGLALFTEGPQLRYQKLHATSSVPGGGGRLPDLIVEAEDRVKVLRSFAMHNDTKRTHVVNAGDPIKINYNYDMGQAALLHVWNGSFLNTNEMWINRGEPQIAKPAGPAVPFDGKPFAAKLPNGSAAWPDSVSWDILRVNGYSIAEDGHPVFQYDLDGVGITDRFKGYADDRRLIRTLHFKAGDTHDDLWMRLASGEDIIRNEAGEYMIDDRTYYLDIIDAGTAEPQVVETEEGQDLRIQLLAESPAATVEYAIIW